MKKIILEKVKLLNPEAVKTSKREKTFLRLYDRV